MKTTRTVLLILFVITANSSTFYTLIIFLNEAIASQEIVSQLLFGGTALSLVAGLACIIFAAVTHKRAAFSYEEQKSLRIPIIVCKLLMIPYFVLITLVSLLMIFASGLLTLSVHLASMGILFGLASIVMIPLISIINYLYIMATSAFSISAIASAGRNGILTRTKTIIFIVLQCLPIADVISYICIVVHINKLEKERGLLI